MRQIQAVVEKNQEGYRCSLSFIPVSCFDASTNQKVNLSKSREYAAKALALFAGIKDQGKVAIKHLALVEKPPVKVGRAHYVYSASAVSVIASASPVREDVPEGKSGGASGITEAGKTDHVVDMHGGETLLGRLGDYRETLHMLGKEMSAAIDSLDRTQLEDSVADLEDRAVTAYEKFSAEVKSEKLLLSLEKEEMINSAKQSQQTLIKRMGEAYEALSEELQLESEPISPPQ